MLAYLIAVTVAYAPADALPVRASDGLPVRPPREVGMSAERLSTIERVVNRGVKAGGFPGAAVVVGRRGYAVLSKGFGRQGWTAGSEAVTAERTIYDLASLTKVVGVATAAMILFDEGRLDLGAPVAKYLPAFGGGNKDLVTVEHLLTHHSGLPAGRDLRRLARTPAEAKSIVLATPLACQPGRCYVYSDLGADVMGWVIEAITGQGLEAFLEERVFTPLGMNDTAFRPDQSVRSRIAPTEVSPPRGYPLRGEVHDENAWALGGVAGHAGLFASAADLSIFAQMMLNKGEYQGVRIASDSAVERFTRRTAGTRALGWAMPDPGSEGTSGLYLSENSYGHTGFTGTSLWIDPDRELFVVLLTNRVHAPRARRPARVIADVRADLSDAAALAVVDADMVLDMPRSFRSDKAVDWNRRVRRAAPVRRPVARKPAPKATTAKTSAPKPGAKSAPTPVRKPATAPAAKPAAKAGAAKAKAGS
ncbi:MAG TPA: serine hydrolase [Gemmatimonadaceae bacterium]|nr:serine hydrolase [Gemmatimonadaceae bacterium]